MYFISWNSACVFRQPIFSDNMIILWVIIWNIFYYPLIVNRVMSLYLKAVSCRQHIDEWYFFFFFFHSAHLSLSWGFPDSSAGKESACNAGDPGSIPRLGRSLEKRQATHSSILGLPLWLSWWRICLQCRRSGFDSWVGKISWRRERLPTPVFWPGEFMDCLDYGVAKSWTRLNDLHSLSWGVYLHLK